MRSLVVRWLVVGGWALCLGLVGCGSGEGQPVAKRVKVQGMVTLDGAPLAAGSIGFIAPGETDPAEIVDGKFTAEVREGEKRVEIRAYKNGAPDTLNPGTFMQENFLPARYNDQSELKANITPQPTELKFELRST
jgi:hypothetical protein